MNINIDNEHSIKYTLVLIKQNTPIQCTQVNSNLIVEREDDLIPGEIKDSIETWIDTLGIESASAQGLKQPITSSNILKNGSIRIHSPVKFCDWIYLLLSIDDENENEDEITKSKCNIKKSKKIFNPIGFLRFGHRSLFLSDPSVNKILVRVNNVICALDFYVRQQRKGLGNFLMKQMISYMSIKSPEQIAFDKPTEAMISFLLKNFNLESPIYQANKYVIFSGFFTFISQDETS